MSEKDKIKLLLESGDYEIVKNLASWNKEAKAIWQNFEFLCDVLSKYIEHRYRGELELDMFYPNGYPKKELVIAALKRLCFEHNDTDEEHISFCKNDVFVLLRTQT